ncbi:MAG: hypothetical protein SVM79_02875 [Chloroflexota bacterium]|nr:hypothetical protein [Chloroflexota bacterium]
MKNKLLGITSLILAGAMLLSPACGAEKSDMEEPQPYEYTHTTELKHFDLYESPRIKDAERSIVMTLDSLGYSDLILAGGENTETSSVEYTLPEDASQGPETWYIIHLHFLIEFDEDTGGGFCSVGASVNDRSGASVHFDTLTVNDSPFIRVGAHSSTSTNIEVRYYNHLSTMGVKPGKNTMTFKIDEHKKAKVKSLRIFSDTGIESTTMPRSEYHEKLKLTQEEQDRAKETAFGNPEVQEILGEKKYSIRIAPDYGVGRVADEIEVRLIFETTCMIEDIEASALGVFVDLNEGRVTDVLPLSPHGMPELTESRKERAVEIALNDPDVQALLEGNEYAIEQIGPCQGGPVGRLGAWVEIMFDRDYLFEGNFPYFPAKTTFMNARIKGIQVYINFKEESVVQIHPQVVPPVGGER